MRAYKRLVLELVLVLAGLILFCKVNSTDEYVIAGVKATEFVYGAETLRPDVSVEPDLGEQGYDQPGSDEQLEIDLPEPKDEQAVTAMADASKAAEGEKESSTDENDSTSVDKTGTDEDTGSGADEEPNVGDKADEEPDEEHEQIMDGEAFAEYRETEEYVRSLLVTGSEHYDPDVVAGAVLPTESNDARYELITGKGYKAYRVGQMPEGFTSDSEALEQMATFDVPVWKMKSDGTKYPTYWTITIHEKLADSVRCIFSDIFLLDMQFPFNTLVGYGYRKVGGSGLKNSRLMSAHAFGVAIDINQGDYDNDYFLGKGNDLRNKNNPYCIPDEVIEIFESYGWYWGGDFDICSDTMHFQFFGLEFLQYESDEPFPILYRGAEDMDSDALTNLQQRLVKLGYLDRVHSSFSKKVDEAVKTFQEEHGLEPDGVVDYETWVPMINLTHDMAFSF